VTAQVANESVDVAALSFPFDCEQSHLITALRAGNTKILNIKSRVVVLASLKQPPTTFLGALRQHMVMGAIQPWGAILGAHKSRQEILDRYAALQRRFAAVLAGRDPILFERGPGPLPRYQVRIGAESRADANDTCKRIRR
jgi:hypothetical protein